MKTSIEQLPVELWISIFSYLEAHDLLQAFTNLNNYFNQLIASNYLLFHVELGKNDHNPLEYSIKPYWPDSILNRIISIHPIIEHKTSHIPEFLRWHCSQLIQLKSLILKLRGREIPVICSVLQQLNSLHYLSIECVPNQILLETILSVPTLRVCRLDFLRALTPINGHSNNISNIEILDIKFQDDSKNSILNLLLSHMPKLKRLEIKIPRIYYDNSDLFFAEPLFILSNLRTIKINCSSAAFNLNFFHNFIYHWWPIFEKKEQINIFLKCQSLQIATDHDMQMNLDTFRANLLAMNEKYNGFIKIKWTEKIFLIYKIIEISICKFC
jgi:uncharacterized protein YsxB (DUF464 family)